MPIHSHSSPMLRLMRFDKPIGILLCLWPTLWALWLATNGHPPLKIVIVFILGVVVMRAAGCVINDIADRKFDGLVNRTKNRPLVTGEVSTQKALVLFSVLCFIALCLVLNLNFFTIKLSVVGLLLAVAYPFTKRFLPFPQFILGMAFNWSIPMAFAATTNTVPPLAWCLYATTLLWTVIYDTQYAMVDQQDDLQIGINSTAIWFGDNIIFILDILHIVILIGFAVIGWKAQMAFPFWIALFVAGLLAVYQHTLVVSKQAQACFKAFLNNNWYGAVLFLGIFFSYL